MLIWAAVVHTVFHFMKYSVVYLPVLLWTLLLITFWFFSRLASMSIAAVNILIFVSRVLLGVRQVFLGVVVSLANSEQ